IVHPHVQNETRGWMEIRRSRLMARADYLIDADIIREMGGAKVVCHTIGVEEGTVRKYMEDPERSGRAMPHDNLRELLSAAASSPNEKLQGLIDERLEKIALPCRRRLIREDDWQKACRLLGVDGEAKRVGPKKAEAVPCPACGARLREIGKGFFGCPRCHG